MTQPTEAMIEAANAVTVKLTEWLIMNDVLGEDGILFYLAESFGEFSDKAIQAALAAQQDAEPKWASAKVQQDRADGNADWAIREAEKASRLEKEVAEMRDLLHWFYTRRFVLQAKFDLHGPKDTAEAMRETFAKIAGLPKPPEGEE